MYVHTNSCLFSLVHWVDHSKTLREQGIGEVDILLLKRKYFYSDANIDSRDPIQLNLLYQQAKEAILNGTHPVRQDDAVQFAATDLLPTDVASHILFMVIQQQTR